MAVENKKTASVTARDATPNTLTNYRQNLKIDGGAFTTVAADDDTSVFRVCRVPSSGRFYGSLKTHGAITGGTDWDLGLYRTAADGGAVVVKDCLLDGIDLSSASAVPSFSALDVGTVIGKYFWELAGLSSDPRTEYDVAWTANTIGSGATDLATYVLFSA